MAFIAGAIGQLVAGQGQAMAQEYNASIARQNAVIAKQQGEAAAEAQSRNAQRTIGSAIAAYGASGVQGGDGSPVDVLADSARMASLDNLTIKYNYALKAQGYNNQASLDDAAAGYARTSSYLKAGASYMSMGSNSGDGYSGGKKIKVYEND